MAALVPKLRVIASGARAEAPARPARDDSELLACVRAGDSSAAYELYERLRPTVEGTIRRLLGPDDRDADDLAQSSFLEIVRGCDAFRGESSLDTWASAVTAHVVYAQIRRRRGERRVFAPEPVDAETAHDRVSGTIVARDLVSRLRALLGTIDQDKAWTFLLHDVCGFDLREIAQITDVSVAAAQSRLVRGRRQVHELIAQDPELADALERKGGER